MSAFGRRLNDGSLPRSDFVSAYNFARRLKTLRGLSRYEAISTAWPAEPSRFSANPLHQMPGTNI